MKQRLYIFLICTLSFNILNAQNAPDFTVTDSWGQPHTLYADYLNQGKTVVLKIFYVACPPCNSIAPFLEPLYQDWGGGEGDVQFIELSIQQGDSDEEVNVYKSTHGTTYPAAGGEGNSVPATIPYTNGTFGLYGGTPTFVVIAPDGTLQYDVYGIGNEGTVEALDAAIEATGAQGLPTSVDEEENDPGVFLHSNLIENELRLSVHKSAEIKINILSPEGKTVLVSERKTIQGVPVSIDLSALSSGLWICRIEEKATSFMASYLFVKI